MEKFNLIMQSNIRWIKVFKNGPSKIVVRQPLKSLKLYFKFFKGCLPQILLDLFLNTFTQMMLTEI